MLNTFRFLGNVEKARQILEAALEKDKASLLYTHQFYRVATAQGKQGIWFSIFPDRENTGKILETQGKFILTDY